MTSRSQTVYLRSNLRTHHGKIYKSAIVCFFDCALLTLMVHELRRHLSVDVGLSGTTVKFDI